MDRQIKLQSPDPAAESAIALSRLDGDRDDADVRHQDRAVQLLALLPSAGRSPAVADALLAEAIRQGLVTLAALPPGTPPPAPPGVISLEQLLAELDQARADR